ncbi:unnamed protein product [Leptidea sinapis]|uniref:Uncharacterized protein n=1 Tax=Leptidea sinapis TaxID=189913 RepID=A0A5E4PXE2_9NEOP|nr:unnamed protein product [Leptidea sinapis]
MVIVRGVLYDLSLAGYVKNAEVMAENCPKEYFVATLPCMWRHSSSQKSNVTITANLGTLQINVDPSPTLNAPKNITGKATNFTTSQCCPEQSRRNCIKSTMSQDNISYLQAFERFPPVSKTYSDVTVNTEELMLTRK